MKFDSFKELLLRKASDDPTLQTLIRFTKDEIIADKIIESLSKMARPGVKTNTVLNRYISTFNREFDPMFIHDAIGHHVSHYRAALKKGDQKRANLHARQALKTLHIAKILQNKLGSDTISVDYESMTPWEYHKTNKTYKQKWDKEYKRAKENWEQQGKKGPEPKREDFKPKPVREGNKTEEDIVTIPKGTAAAKASANFSYLNKPPHAKGAHKTKHTGGYPFEEIKINDKYIHIDDEVKPENIGKKHSFDNHPILKYGLLTEGGLEKIEQKENVDIEDIFDKEMEDWEMSDIPVEMADKIHAKMSNPDFGMKPFGPVHDLEAEIKTPGVKADFPVEEEKIKIEDTPPTDKIIEPEIESPSVETPIVEAPIETPTVDKPIIEDPVETPVVDKPIIKKPVETPAVEPAKPETAPVDIPKPEIKIKGEE